MGMLKEEESKIEDGMSADVDSTQRKLDEAFEFARPLRKWTDLTIQHVAAHLKPYRTHWSNYTRLYIVLRLINQLEILDTLISHGVTDFWLPFKMSSFPVVISPDIRREFLKTQWVVLTQAIELEKPDSLSHQHFDTENIPAFESKELLGRGAYGEVDKVYSTLSHKLYARKRIQRGTQFLKARRNMEDFEKELGILKRLRHHHIVELVGSYTDPTYVGLLVSPVAECNLKHFLSTASSTPSKALLRRALGCLAAGLAYMHNTGVRHKDIKPENILVEGESVLYTDFGISHLWEDLDHSTTQDTAPRKTPMYSAPELFEHAPRNSSSDVWSLGCVFVEIATILNGRQISDLRKYLGDYGNKSQVYCKNLDGVWTWLAGLKYDTKIWEGKQALQWVGQMLSKSPSSRPSAQQLFEYIVLSSGEEKGSEFYVGSCCHSASGAGTGQPFMNNSDLAGVNTPQTISNIAMSANNPTSKKLLPKVKASVAERLLHTRLIAAIRDGKTSRIQALIEEGANIYKADYSGRTPLHFAAGQGQDTVVSQLVAAGAIVDAPGGVSNCTPLWIACSEGHTETARALLKAKANPNSQDKDLLTPLHMGACRGHDSVIDILLDYGADISLRDSNGRPPLYLAVQTGQFSSAKLLIDRGDDVNSRGWSGREPLMVAAVFNHPRLVELLIKRGAAVNSCDDDGWTSLSLACNTGDLETVKLLVNAGADISISNNQGSPLLFAAWTNKASIVEFLIDQGAEVNQRNQFGETPLHKAAGYNSISAVKVLLENRADNGAITIDGASPLDIAVSNGHEEMVELLLEAEGEESTTDGEHDEEYQ